MTAMTGQKCPQSGVWKVDGHPNTKMLITLGDPMPPYGSKDVTWRLVQVT